MNIREDLLETLNELKSYPRVDQAVLQKFLDWSKNNKLLRGEGSKHHLCAMFAPYDQTRKEVFLINHRKAKMWMIPGGHVEVGESLYECLQREYFEELGRPLQVSKLELFDLTITPITDRPDCETHYDIWYVANVPRQDFTIEEAAFSDSGWFPLDQALKMFSHEGFRLLLSKFDTL